MMTTQESYLGHIGIDGTDSILAWYDEDADAIVVAVGYHVIRLDAEAIIELVIYAESCGMEIKEYL